MAVTAALASMLTALSLAPLVAGHTWLFVAAITVITVMVSGIIARQLLRWWVPVAAVQTVVLLLTLLVLFARSRITEGPLGIGVLVDLLRSGFEVTRQQAPPVDATQGIVLLVAGSAGLVALAVDVLAVSLRQPALAGLPLLAVYCVPAALISGGLPWYYFLAAAAGFLILLAADSGDRVRGWGRVLSSAGGRGGMRAFDAGLARGGRRIGAVTAVVAVLLPALVPGLGNHLLGSDGSGDGKGKGRTITRINPILNLKDDLVQGDDTVLMRYKTTAKNPAPLRIVTADVFNGDVWEPSTNPIPSKNQATNGLPAAPGLNLADVATTNINTSIQIGDLKQTYLPLPYPTVRLQAPGTWLYDETTLNVIGDGQTTQGLNYSATSLEVDPTADQLNDAGAAGTDVSSYLSLPVKIPKLIVDDANRIAQSGTPYEEAIRLQRWFRDGDFTYSTDAPTTSTGDSGLDAIVKFLQVKRGYCVHFASTMAVMARILNIPARVAVGFLPGTLDKNGWYDVTAKDAHAWPELYFEGVGWVRFEPTPRTGEATPPSWTVPPPGVMPEDTTPTDEPSATASSAPSASASARAPKDTSEGAVAHSTTGSGFELPWKGLALVLVLLALAAAPKLTSSVSSRRRWSAARSSPALAEAAWEDLRRGLGDLGVTWVTAWTPRAAQHRLVADHDLPPDAAAALGRLAGEVEDARYAPPSEDLGRPAGERQDDVSTVLAAVARRLSRPRRWLARLWPPSGITAIGAVGSWVSSRADRAGEQVSGLGHSVRDKVGSGRR
jgi:transglutaminase-like putative cysteine protease